MEKYLAEDMLVEILLRLSIKSLVRFRCVCRSWYKIIGSTSFLKSQKDITPNPNNRYLLCRHRGFYSLYGKEELINYKKFNYKPELFGINPRLKVHGFCEGLLCVSNGELVVDSLLYLLNPIIRKAKRIPNISFDIPEQRGDSDLCLGYLGGDYKVIKIALFSGVYRVGIYSLSTNSWKITYSDSKGGIITRMPYSRRSKFVNGVAYFIIYNDIIVCFDLHDKMIRELKYPEKFGIAYAYMYTSFAMEAYRESVALVEIKDRLVLSVWVLKNCCMWEMKVRVGLETAPDCHPMGFLNNDTYLLGPAHRRSGYFYSFNLENSELKDLISEGEPKRLRGINSFVGSLALINEQTIDPVVEMETCSTRTTLTINTFCGEIAAATIKDNKDTSHEVQQQGSNTDRSLAMFLSKGL